VTPITVRLHKSLYLPAALREAARDFAELATFTFARDGDWHVVTLAPTVPAQGDIAGEFCNFALARTATRKRRKPG